MNFTTNLCALTTQVCKPYKKKSTWWIPTSSAQEDSRKNKRRNEMKAGMSWSLNTPPQLKAGELIFCEEVVEVVEGLLFEDSDVFWEIN